MDINLENKQKYMQVAWQNIHLGPLFLDSEHSDDSLRSFKMLFDTDGRLDLSYTA